MRIDNQDIIRVAQQLRDEENAQLSVGPWSRQRHHFHVPTWLVAIPAAVIIGFVLGIWTQKSNQSDAPLTALVDTVYVKVYTSQSQQDSVCQAVHVEQNASEGVTSVLPKPTPRQTVRRSTASPIAQPAVGSPVADDHIRYDLLVRN